MQKKLLLLTTLVLLFQSPGALAKASVPKTFTHPSAHYSFQYPASAKTSLGNEDTGGTKKDTVTVKWKGGFLAVQLLDMPLKKAIDTTGALTLDEHGKYYRPGRFDAKGETKPLKYGALSGLYGVSMCGISDSTGFHAAAGSCLSGFLSDGKKTAYFETDGIFPPDYVVRRVFPSFHLGK